MAAVINDHMPAAQHGAGQQILMRQRAVDQREIDAGRHHPALLERLEQERRPRALPEARTKSGHRRSPVEDFSFLHHCGSDNAQSDARREPARKTGVHIGYRGGICEA